MHAAGPGTSENALCSAPGLMAAEGFAAQVMLETLLRLRSYSAQSFAATPDGMLKPFAVRQQSPAFCPGRLFLEITDRRRANQTI